MTADLIARTRPTLRELYNQIAQHTHRVVVGPPEQVAESMQLWFESGAADGFRVSASGIKTMRDNQALRPSNALISRPTCRSKR